MFILNFFYGIQLKKSIRFSPYVSCFFFFCHHFPIFRQSPKQCKEQKSKSSALFYTIPDLIVKTYQARPSIFYITKIGRSNMAIKPFP